ncbi:hypothetical protein DB43_HL00360 [Parachlamydia acanthamoebae]|uniref:Uncharacterized protein n=1 Tax=Parachlamydia acanthamoebae TaxID=83552 RepID=A0A0C1E5Z8_9BACT|nr:hypothetical protein DB43_HL00360 [Parachlamydia acanthamoebae]
MLQFYRVDNIANCYRGAAWIGSVLSEKETAVQNKHTLLTERERKKSTIVQPFVFGFLRWISFYLKNHK